MVKKLRDSVVLYPRRLEVSRVNRDRVKKAIAALMEGTSAQVRSPTPAKLHALRTKRTVAARAARRRIAERSVP